MIKQAVAVLSVAMSVFATASPALAQDFPNKPVRIVVPFAPGGTLDIVGRLIGAQLQEAWKNPVIVENRPGASGMIGADFVAKAAPDGHTLLMISATPIVTAPHLQKVPFDVLKDLTGVSQTTLLVYALIASPKTGLNSVQELIEQAKKEPNRFNYSSAGNGSGQHLFVELFKSAANINLTHVPYKGSGPALNAVMAGEVDLTFDVTLSTVPVVKSGKAKALMVTGAKPLEQLPGAAPFEKLYPGFGIEGWHGIFTAAATPKPLVDRIGRDIMTAVQSPAISNRFRDLGVEPASLTSDRFNAVVKRDYERWGEIIRKNNIRAD
jgi:tripartite-type tricarboxylate transporter receptor subunit TctC